MKKGEWFLSLAVIAAIGVALASGVDRDAASQPAAQPSVASGGGCGCCGHGSVDTAAEASCCGEKAEAVAASDESADPAACCPMVKQASMASAGGCGGCSGGLDAAVASSSGGCPYAKMVSAEAAECSKEACDAEGECCSTDGTCCKKDASVADAGCCSEGSCPVKEGAVAATTVSRETVVAEKKCCSADGACCKKNADGSCCKSAEADSEKPAEPNEKQANAEAADAGLVQN